MIKISLDTGEVATLEEALRLFKGYRLAIVAGPDIAHTATGQVALLTSVNTARRCFMGGVHVAGPMDARLRVPWGNTRTLGEAVLDLQGVVVDSLPRDVPTIVIGDAPMVKIDNFGVRATWEGWSGGVVPLNDGRRLDERTEFTPAGVLAGATAVSEAFQHVRGDNPLAGRRDAGLSLWKPQRDEGWLAAEQGPAMAQLPSRLWLIGLGHLGQAYLWTLGFLPYVDAGEVELILQDVDVLTEANDSTSPLTHRALCGEEKTRAMAAWAKVRGFRTKIIERLFAANFRVDAQEPQVAVCGVDNAMARAALEDVGFERVVEAGLGKGAREYLDFQLHTFPSHRTAHAVWDRRIGIDRETAALTTQPAYRALVDSGIDECGITQLAGRTVGASFVGMTVASLVVAELLRMSLGMRRYEVIDGSLRSLEHREAVLAADDVVPFNPGITSTLLR